LQIERKRHGGRGEAGEQTDARCHGQKTFPMADKSGMARNGPLKLLH
jgi:hypothetical protein